MGNPSYKELLKSPLWQRRRLETYQRDNWTCQWCGDTEHQLQVHHKYYLPDTLPWDYPDDALVTLCDCCHSRHSFIEWINKKGESLLFNAGYDIFDCKELVRYIARKTEITRDRDFILPYIKNIRDYLRSGDTETPGYWLLNDAILATTNPIGVDKNIVLYLTLDEPTVKEYSNREYNPDFIVTFNKRFDTATIWDAKIFNGLLDRVTTRVLLPDEELPTLQDAQEFLYDDHVGRFKELKKEHSL